MMNEFVCNIVNSVNEKSPYEKNRLSELGCNISTPCEACNFSEITEEEIVRASLSFKTSFGSEIFNSSSVFIKTAAPFIGKYLAYIFNRSLVKGQFLNIWKMARIVPIYIKGSSDERSKYSPISVLPVLSCLVEKLVYNQLYKYHDRHRFLYKHQSGFRSIHSVVICLLSNTCKWYLSLDDKKYTGMVFVDLNKAFDTMDHDILAKKLPLWCSKYGAEMVPFHI